MVPTIRGKTSVKEPKGEDECSGERGIVGEYTDSTSFRFQCNGVLSGKLSQEHTVSRAKVATRPMAAILAGSHAPPARTWGILGAILGSLAECSVSSFPSAVSLSAKEAFQSFMFSASFFFPPPCGRGPSPDHSQKMAALAAAHLDLSIMFTAL